jgi:D-alanyl-D-alanine carboxypeptidase/D-alanyl-D-alanine-endopeptidase (penicillin-binding protein 4)
MKTGKKGSGDNGYIYGAPWQWLQQLEGTIPAGVKEFSIKGALPDPAKFTAQYLKKEFEKTGISIQGLPLKIQETKKQQSKRKLLYTHSSPHLKEIVYHLNKRSVNLYAEQLLKLLGKKIKGQGTLESGLDVITAWLQENNISDDGLFLLDGSGLSRANAVTTKFFVELLEGMSNKPTFNTFYNSFPIAGDPDDNGTMRHLCKGSVAAKKLRAKTGGHNRVRAHTGYVYLKSGDLICFSMIANNYSGTDRTIDKLHEKIMIELAALGSIQK